MAAKEKREGRLAGCVLLTVGLVGLAATVAVIAIASTRTRSLWPQGVPSDTALPPRAGSRGLSQAEGGETLADKLYLPTSRHSFAIAYGEAEEIVILFAGNGSHDGVSVNGLWSGVTSSPRSKRGASRDLDPRGHEEPFTRRPRPGPASS